ncbi:GNAT family N-acetyltransferase [Clostridium sp.]|uniref:GNAT family N-acetyltransferase n=1 Tax=Clostridium sp. TaxID=1506 RepID=UPI002FCB7FD5
MDKDLFHSLEGTDIYFKLISTEDTEDMHEYTSDKECKRFIGWRLMQNPDETREFIEELVRRESAGTHLYASVVLKSNDKVIGTVMLFNFDKEANQAEVGYVFNRGYWGKGYGTESIALVSKFGFESLKLHKLHASVVGANIGSARLLEKNGYELEGRLKDHFFIEDKYYDDLLFGKFEAN